jgi:hypothetical protein
MRTLFLTLLFSAAADAQLFSAGIKFGIPPTDPFENLTFPAPNSTA